MAQQGGKREGAGRKKGSKASHTLQAAIAKQQLIEKYIENAKPINQALVDKALTGDIQAIKEIHDRVWGKAPQSVDMNVTDETYDEERIRAAAKKLNELRTLHN